MGSLANLPSFAAATSYTHTDFNAAFAALTIAAGAVGTNELANQAVTLAKMQNIATASLLGRNTAGSGAPEILSVATARSLLGIGTRGLQNDGDSVIMDVGQVNRLTEVPNTGYVTAGAIALAIDAKSSAYIGLTGNPTFSIAGQQSGYHLNMLLKNTTGGSLNLTWPAWSTPDGITLPTTLAAGAFLLIRLRCMGTLTADVVATYN